MNRGELGRSLETTAGTGNIESGQQQYINKKTVHTPVSAAALPQFLHLFPQTPQSGHHVMAMQSLGKFDIDSIEV